jgi:hypothetical protein
VTIYSTFYCLLSYIFIVSDGVHDNFDPQAIGISPKECGSDKATWDEMERDYMEEIKTNFRNQRITELILKHEKVCEISIEFSNLLRSRPVR